MVTFPIGVGGMDRTPDRPGPGKLSGDQSWREPPRVGRGERPAPSGIDWEHDEKYFTPQPGPKVHYGTRHVDWQDPLPEAPVKMISVRAVPPATTYTTEEGMPIPADRFEIVPISPHILHAIKEGDLERGPDPHEGPPNTLERGRPRQTAAPRATTTHERERRHHPTPPVEPPAE